MDSTTKDGWLLANWVPENTKVRQKMLYASSRETLKRELGSADITAEIIAAVRAVRATPPHQPKIACLCDFACLEKKLRACATLPPLSRQAKLVSTDECLC